MATATLHFGAKEERERRLKEEQDKYQLVLEEEEMINFVSSAITMKGTRSEKVSVKRVEDHRDGKTVEVLLFCCLLSLCDPPALPSAG